MKSNIDWKTDYYVKIKDCIVGMVFHHEEQSFWTVYIRTSNKTVLQFLFDELTNYDFKAKYSEEPNKIDVLIDIQNEETYLGGYLPEKYEKLLDKLSECVYELLEKFNEKQGENLNG